MRLVPLCLSSMSIMTSRLLFQKPAGNSSDARQLHQFVKEAPRTPKAGLTSFVGKCPTDRQPLAVLAGWVQEQAFHESTSNNSRIVAG